MLVWTLGPTCKKDVINDENQNKKRDAVKRHKNTGPIWPIINNIAAKLEKNEDVFSTTN